jgi:penicillin amidase
MRRLHPLLPVLLLLSCPKPDEEPEPSPLLGVDETAAWKIPGMEGTAYVVTTEAGVPYVFAENDADLGRVVGFVLARDRYFYMDVARRLSLGTVAGLLGADALTTDIEHRQLAATWIADRATEQLDLHPDVAAYFDGVAEGINAYVDEVAAGNLPAPSEYDIAYALLGATSPEALMTRFTRRDVVGGMITVLYETGFESKDVGRAADAARLATLFVGADHEALRRGGLEPGPGLEADVWGRVEPVHLIAAAPDWADRSATSAPRPRPPRIQMPPSVLERLRLHTDAVERRLGHDWEHGFGSNAWAVAASASADGRAMVATDGHLDLTTPPLFYQIGINTEHLGGGPIRQVGMMTPAMPLISTGTNGDVAFGQTQLIGDITDWYSEVLILDEDGAPASTIFQGQERPVSAFQEDFTIAAVPLLGSQAGTLSITRYTTFDGRWITSVEGRVVDGPEDAGPGETAINLMGTWIIPGDTAEDDDDQVSAVSFDYAGLDMSVMAAVLRNYSAAEDLDAFATATRDLVAYSLNLVAADKNGDILYTGFQAVPCRTYLERNPDGTWAEGADPNLLLDGMKYGGFTIPLDDKGMVDESQGADPYRCIVPWEEYPHSRDPDQGFLVSANNDPGGLTFDGSLTDDPWYIGGPWMEGFRPQEITEDLTARKADGGVSMDDMKAVQANHTSVIGKLIGGELLAAVQTARELIEDGVAAGEDTPEARMVQLYQSNPAALEEAHDRISAWADRGWQAESGVSTFYHEPTPEQRQDAVATSIFNAWMGRYVGHTVGDEGIPGLGWPTGDTGRFRLLRRMLDGRGAGNPLDMGSFNPDTEESIYFDIQGTEPLETSAEVSLLALVDALEFLASEPTDPGRGGFGTTEMDAWLWGLRHWVKFDSLLVAQFGLDDPLLAPIVDPLTISPNTFPIADDIAPGDPREDLPGFPRPADNLCVDAGNSGTSGTSFDFGSGSVWRFVVALGGSGFEAYNIIPGGQSGIVDSPYFSDQAKLWLGNEYLPVYIEPADIAAAGLGRETFTKK